jgi:hypothetical protein
MQQAALGNSGAETLNNPGVESVRVGMEHRRKEQ